MDEPFADLVEVTNRALGDDLPAESLAAAIDEDLAYLGRRPAAETTRLGDAVCTVLELRVALEALRDAVRAGERPGDATTRGFRVFRSRGRPGGPLFTGYYEPVVEGRLAPNADFVHPLYRRPEDLVEVSLGDFDPRLANRRIYGRVEGGRLEPYLSRREIEDGALADRGLELAWLDDPVALYFLHVQGSGVIRLGDGRTMRVGFAGANGRQYTSIGRLLVEDGSLARGGASAPAIQRYLREHPERRREVFDQNERYVFYREVADGPIGSLGVKLTPGRSIAADPTLYPPGSLAYVTTTIPEITADGRFAGGRPIARFVVVQDAGAAITGPGRVDLFFGTGDRAGLEAGYMSAGGELHFVAPDCVAR